MLRTVCTAAVIVSVFTATALAQPLRPGAPAPPAKQEPLIPNNPDAYTQAQFEKEVLIPFFTTSLVDAYKTKGDRNPKWDQDAIAFLDSMVLYEADAPGQPTLATAHAEAERIVERLKCTDPLIRYYRWRLEMAHWRWSWKEKVLPIAQEIEERGYPMWCRAAAYTLEFVVQQNWGDSTKTRVSVEKAIDRWHKAFTEAGDDHGVHRALCELFERVDYNINISLVNKSFDTTPIWLELAERLVADQKVNRGTAFYFRGMQEFDAAWDVRGGGWAREVKPENWKGFGEYMRLASKDFRRAHAASPKRPGPPSKLIGVVAASAAPAGESILTWFRKTVHIQIDYMPAYRLMYTYLRPRWGGSNQLMLQMGLNCAATRRYDTEIPMMLSLFIKHVHLDLDRQWEPLIRSGALVEMVKVFQAMEKEARWKGGNPRHQSRHAAFAARTGDYVEANRVIRAMREPLLTNFTMDAHYPAPSLHRLATARGGAAGKQVLKADERYELQDFAGAKKGYQAALVAIPENDPGRAYVKARLKAIEWRQRFDAGGWVNLTVDDELSGWDVHYGEWRATDDGKLRGRSDRVGRNPTIICDARFGNKYELTVDLEVDERIKWKDYNVAVLFAYTDTPLWRFRAFTLYPVTNDLAMRRSYYIGDDFAFEPGVPRRSSVRIVMFGREKRIYLNGKLAHNLPWLKPNEVFGHDDRIGFGSRNYRARDQHWFTVSNVRIRKLTEKPAEIK